MIVENYHTIPHSINPLAMTIGSFEVRWYSVMWVVALISVYVILLWRIKHREFSLTKDALGDVLFYGTLGAIIGGRIGYVLFYNRLYFFQHPLAIISPYDIATHTWVGIYGMSYHGGLLGLAVALWIWTRKNAVPLLALTDFLVPVAPVGYFFGRIGNFLNGELYGRTTTSPLGMIFDDGLLRHPSQLYEACGEGLLLFIILWRLRHHAAPPGTMTAYYLIGYALVRFIVEFFRQPDAQIGFVVGTLSMGQVLSLLMLLVGGGLLWFSRTKSAHIF